MSKKRFKELRSQRLNSLFADLEQETGDFTSPTLPDASGWVWECDSNWNYLSCSPEVEELLGIPPDRFIGQPVTSFALAPESRSVLEAALGSDENPLAVQAIFETLSGGLLTVSFHILRSGAQAKHNGNSPGCHGFTQVIESESSAHPPTEPEFNPPKEAIPAPGWPKAKRPYSIKRSISGFLIEETGGLTPAKSKKPGPRETSPPAGKIRPAGSLSPFFQYGRGGFKTSSRNSGRKPPTPME